MTGDGFGVDDLQLVKERRINKFPKVYGIPNPKHEIRNKSKIRMTKFKTLIS